MQTYDERIKATHQRARQRKLITFSPDSLPAAGTPSGFAPVVAVAFKPTFTPALDDTDRVAVFTVADPQHRIGVGKVTKPARLVCRDGLGRHLRWRPGDGVGSAPDEPRAAVGDAGLQGPAAPGPFGGRCR